MSTLSIIIPVFNEQNTIIQILDKLTEVSLLGTLSKEIIIIDENDKYKNILKIQ